MYVFCSDSTTRWQVLLKYITNLTLKPLSKTRWERRIDALKPFQHHIGDIYDTLFDVVDNNDLDTITKYEAYKKFLIPFFYCFLACIKDWYVLVE